MSKAKQLRERMSERGLVHIMAAHSPLSAVLAEEVQYFMAKYSYKPGSLGRIPGKILPALQCRQKGILHDIFG